MPCGWRGRDRNYYNYYNWLVQLSYLVTKNYNNYNNFCPKNQLNFCFLSLMR